MEKSQINPNWQAWNDNPELDKDENPHEKYLNMRLVRPAQTEEDEDFDRDWGTEL